jgi:XTP/dITP diphosphohydrolase
VIRLVFATSNPFKIAEAKSFAKGFGIQIVGYSMKIHELQTDDLDALVHAKALEAFQRLRLPVMVDHASLRMSSLAGMPGSLTQLFWDQLGGAGLTEIARLRVDPGAIAVSTVAYCDAKRIHVFSAEQHGRIADRPRGTRKFQWDTIFQPDGVTRTYAQMSIKEKNAISQRGRALTALFDHVAAGPLA